VSPPIQAPPVLLLWTAVYLVIGATWITIWRPVVRWTPKRIAQTVTTALVAIAAGVAFGFTIFMVGRSNQMPMGIAVLLGGGFPPIVWVLATVMVWRETNAERTVRLAGGSDADSVVCPMCGYDMRGVRMAQCPECGVEFTLGQLVRAQPKRALQALDDE